MTTDTITADDTFTLYDRVIADFADGDASTITFPNEIFSLKTGKNGNSIYVKNETGKNSDVDLRIIAGSSDDKFLQGKLAAMESDFPSSELATGEFRKRVGDGQTNVTAIVYTLRGGIIRQKVDTRENVEGDTDQAVAVYRLRFARTTRSHQ